MAETSHPDVNECAFQLPVCRLYESWLYRLSAIQLGDNSESAIMSPDDRKGLICTEEINRRRTTLRFRIGRPTPMRSDRGSKRAAFYKRRSAILSAVTGRKKVFKFFGPLSHFLIGRCWWCPPGKGSFGSCFCLLCVGESKVRSLERALTMRDMAVPRGHSRRSAISS